MYSNIDVDEEVRLGGSGENRIEYEFKPSLASMSGLDGKFNLISTLGSVGEEEILECDNEVNLRLPFEMKGDRFASSKILNRNKESIYHFKRDFLADSMRYVIQTSIDGKDVALVRARKKFQLNLDLKYFQIPGDYHSVRHIEVQSGFFQKTNIVYEGITVIAVIKRKITGLNYLNPLENFTIHINHPSDIRLALLSMTCIYGQLLAYKSLAYFLITIISTLLLIYTIF